MYQNRNVWALQSWPDWVALVDLLNGPYVRRAANEWSPGLGSDAEKGRFWELGRAPVGSDSRRRSGPV
ncbi:hypothetical protein V6N12_036844 [Hibiscus sabdariffa]|uniref:Uncharacterized protein n=1 Tax=Hibiscus sabdariffa TaxID=183260 RepID=A0ABR2BV17_9ROSI